VGVIIKVGTYFIDIFIPLFKLETGSGYVRFGLTIREFNWIISKSFSALIIMSQRGVVSPAPRRQSILCFSVQVTYWKRTILIKDDGKDQSERENA